jgi:peptide/nickel transport system substrate-binding protein
MVMALVACAPAPAVPSGGASATGGDGQGPPAPRPTRTIRFAITREPHGFVNSFTPNATGAGGITLVQPLAANRLQTFDEKGRNIPELATAIPSTSDGTWTVNPDGTMETIWKLQPNVTWHDGTGLTADDIVFGYQAATTPGVISIGAAFLRGISDVSAIDPYTVSVKWKAINANADKPRDDLPILPRHLLEADLQAKGGDAFNTLPYWKTEYIGTGPFRLTGWQHDEQLEFAAYGQYFRGRPKVDRIVVRIIPDGNTQIANVLAGEVDVIFPTDAEAAIGLREQWQGTQNQVLVGSPGQLRNIFPQNRESSISAPVLLDPRVRRALYRSVDRQAVSEAISRGAAPIADSIIPPFYDIRQDFESIIPQYSYDLAQAQRELLDLGFTRGADGIMRMPNGQEFRFEITTLTPGRSEREQAAATIGWKEMGIQMNYRIRPTIEAGDEELRSKISAMEVTGGSFDDFFDLRLNCTSIPGPSNNWRGRNSMGWCHQETQILLDRLPLTIAETDRTPIMRSFVRTVMTEVAIMPLYWDVDAIPVLAGVKGVLPPTTPARLYTWNVREWEKE